MNLIKSASLYLLDFLFPKEESLSYIESLSAIDLLHKLPRAKDQSDENLIVLFDYKDKTVQKMIWELKYSGNRLIASKFALLLNDILRIEIAERALYHNFQEALIIPIPTSNIRRRERGYNPTEILCEEIKKLDTDNLFEYSPSLLIKTKHTESQARTHATKRERMENIHNSFSISDPQEIKGRNIIVIDDVTTSGSTFAEAKRALKGAHARRLLFVALAN